MSNHPTFLAFRTNLEAGKTSCVEQVTYFLNRIEERKSLNCFLEVFGDEALLRAKEVDERVRTGKAGKLAGMVVALKDNICFKGHRISAASKILGSFSSIYSATVVERLLHEDAIIIGRANCDEFAMGSSNENSAFGPVLNPIDEQRSPGGSSGGSAAAVAAGLCHVALGSDTGGSIRQPASFCGLVGMKPTYGRISRYGLIAYASSFDQIGPLTHTIADAALLLEVIAGADGYDSTASSLPVEAYSANLDPKNKPSVALITEFMNDTRWDREIHHKIEKIVKLLQDKGHTAGEASFPYLDHMVPAYYVLTTAEASSNLSRYGGVLYGYRSPNATDIDSTYRKSRSEGFGPEVKRRILLGTFVLSSGYYDAYYSNAQKVRRILRDKTNEILEKFDFILLPTTPKTAFKLGEISDPVTMYLEDIFTVQANLTGLPAISIPLGTHSNGMPFGLQLIGRKFSEQQMLAFASELEAL